MGLGNGWEGGPWTPRRCLGMRGGGEYVVCGVGVDRFLKTIVNHGWDNKETN